MKSLYAVIVSTLLLCSDMVAVAGDISPHTAPHTAPHAMAVHRRALSQPMVGMSAEERARFDAGRSLFNQMWVVAPSQDSEVDGLGPLFNRLSCAACHPGNGRGRAPDGPDDEMRAMLVRLSLPGAGPHGEPLPHPHWGDQLQEQAVPGVEGEGDARIEYSQEFVLLRDGTAISLRRPRLLLRTLPADVSTDGLLTSARIGTALVGVGLLDAIPEAAILAWADPEDRDGDGISGRPNRVWDAIQQRQALGRFGHKANTASLRQQTAAASVGDMGITSTLFPRDGCVTVACQSAANGGEPELTDAQLDAMVFFQQMLAVPMQRHRDSARVQRGRQVFQQAGCAGCHRPAFQTASDAQPAQLASREIQPYTDLLLHDMGEDLADGRPDFAATGREWRTAPLWGIGLAEVVADRVSYLHDGRARTVLEAVLWHGGEAAASRDAVVEMETKDREALLAFLGSL